MLWQENEKKLFFLSRIVLPHDQQQGLIQTVTIKKADIHSNTSLRNEYIHCFGKELGKLCPARNTNAFATIVLSQDRSGCSGINITAMRQKQCHILTSLVKRIKSEFGVRVRAILPPFCANS